MTPLRAADWPNWVRPGSRVFVGSGAACPLALMRSLLAEAPALNEIELVHAHTLGDVPWLDPTVADTFTVNSFAAGPLIREAVRRGRADYTPSFLSEIPGLFLDGILPLDVALVQVTPPDAHGYCSLGVNVDIVSAACRAARTVIAQINPCLPRTHGQSFLHCDRIAAFIEVSEELPRYAEAPPSPADVAVAGYLAQLIRDGSTLRVGVGPLAEAVLAALGHHNDLGVHTEVIGDGYLRLIKSGVINNRRKTLHPGKTITASCQGSRELYDYVHDNPHVEFHPAEYVCNPLVIARNAGMVAIATADEVDLSGQAVAHSRAGEFSSGAGSQVDYLRGAAMSQDGMPIIALASTTADGAASRIVPQLQERAGVLTARGDVHYVVTEYGVATLRGRSMRERALELIQVAHPRFRDELRREAVAGGLLPAYQQASPRPVPDLGDFAMKRLQLGGQEYLLRPLQPSDIRRLQEFFYSHTLETVQMRYGFAVARMTRERAYDLVNVDQTRDLALAIFETQGPRQIIHAVGRYYLDANGRGAEAAFVVRETKRRLGMASTLLSALMAVARRRGLEFLWGRVRKDNLPMLALFRRVGGQVIPAAGADDGSLDVRVPLDAESREVDTGETGVAEAPRRRSAARSGKTGPRASRR